MDRVSPSNEARKEYLRLVRNIANAALCISEYANNEEAWAQERSAWVHWGHVGTAGKVLEDLKEICRFLNIELKEV